MTSETWEQLIDSVQKSSITDLHTNWAVKRKVLLEVHSIMEDLEAEVSRLTENVTFWKRSYYEIEKELFECRGNKNPPPEDTAPSESSTSPTEPSPSSPSPADPWFIAVQLMNLCLQSGVKHLSIGYGPGVLSWKLNPSGSEGKNPDFSHQYHYGRWAGGQWEPL